MPFLSNSLDSSSICRTPGSFEPARPIPLASGLPGTTWAVRSRPLKANNNRAQPMHFIGTVRLGLPCAKCLSEEHLGEGTANMGEPPTLLVSLSRNGRRPEQLQRRHRTAALDGV